MTTELVALAAHAGEPTVELPVVLADRLAPTRVRWAVDGAEMLVSLVRLRRRLGPVRRNRVISVPTGVRI
jgi:hypothetical protein